MRSFSIINIAILGRILTPDDFGVAALAMVVISLLSAFSDLKISGALVALDNIDSATSTPASP